MRIRQTFFQPLSVLILGGISLLMFAAVARADGPGEVATGYFVDCSAGANGNGSVGSPWNSVASVQKAQFEAGTDVWFKAGTTCAQQRLVVDWNGTPDNYAIVGTYYMSGGVPYQLTPDNPMAWPRHYTWSHGKPAVLSGTYRASCSVARGGTGKCPYGPGTGAVPDSQYEGLVDVQGSYVRVQSLQTADSSGYGFLAGKTGTHHIVFDGVDVNYSAMTGILHTRATDVTVRNSRVVGASVGSRKGGDNRWDNFGACLATVRSGPSSAGMYPPSRGLFEHNEVGECYGEGIDLLLTNFNVVRSNLVYGTSSSAIYCERCQNAIIESNVVLGNKDGVRGEFGNRSIELGLENFAFNPAENIANVVIRNNLIANTGSCVSFSSLMSSPREAGTKVSFQFVGNTCLATSGNYIAALDRPAENLGKIVIANNVFDLTQSSTPASACAVTDTPTIEFHHNGWSARQNNPKCRGVGDVIGRSAVTNGFPWTNAGKSIVPSVNDFQLGPSSPFRGAATPLHAPLGALLTGQAAEYKQNVFSPCPSVDSVLLTKDYHCADRSDGASVGALIGAGHRVYRLTAD